ncbi:MAG: hypothetical protein E7575_00805 [Ruminococcaceae bacterium]|nr:hypothetical protein [Oscillospiraceae bacterium]
MKKNVFYRIISSALAFICVFSLFSCSPLKSTKKERTVIMTVGEYKVPYEVYYYISKNLESEKLDEKSLKAEAIDMIKEIYAVFSLAEEYGISFDDKYIKANADKAAEQAIEACGGEKEYANELDKSYLNDSTYRFLERHNLTAESLLLKIKDSKEYAMDRKAKLAFANSDELIRIKQILITGEGGTAGVDDTYYLTNVEHTDEQALAIAEEAHKKALAGEDFDKLVSEYGESLFMFNNTDGYYLCRGMWDKEAEDAAFALEIGEISPVIKTDGGYSVLLRCEKSDEYILNNLDEITEDYYKALYKLLIEERKGELEVKTNSAYDKYVG